MTYRVEPQASRAVFRLLEGAITITSPSFEIARQVAALFPSYAVDDCDAPGSEEYHLCGLGPAWVVGAAGDTPEPVDELSDALAAVENLIAVRLLGQNAQLAHLHAAGFVADGAAVVMLGPSGAGKSSLALEVSLRGLASLGDDVLFITEDEVAAPFKRLFKVHRQRLTQHSVPTNPSLDWLGDDEENWFDPATAGGWAEPTPIHRVAHVRYERGASLSVRPLSKPETLSLIIASLFPLGLGPQNAFDRLLHVANSASGIELVYGDAARAADALVAPT